MTATGDDRAAPVPDAGTIAGLLADDDRRRVFAALVLGGSTLDEVRAATGLTARRAASAIARLVDGDLVVRGDRGAYLLLGEAFRLAAMAASERPGPDPTDDVPDDDARILRRYFRGGRLTQIPAQRARKLVILDRLAQTCNRNLLADRQSGPDGMLEVWFLDRERTRFGVTARVEGRGTTANFDLEPTAEVLEVRIQ